jgi:hypothetical protein
MPYFEKRENEETGAVEYVEVADKDLKLPDEHPLVKAFTATKEELKEAKSRPAAQATPEKPEEKPEAPAKQPETPVAPIDPDELVNRVVEKLTAKQTAEQQAKQTREQQIDQIIADTKLDPTFRPVIEAIADPDAARKQAELLASRGLKFEQPAGGGNGKSRLTDLLGGVDKRLGLEPKQ